MQDDINKIDIIPTYNLSVFIKPYIYITKIVIYIQFSKMSRKFLITEEEKNEIRGLYGLINEAIDPKSGGTITINNYYKPGFYTLDSVDTKSNQAVKNNLTTALKEVTDFVRLHPDSIVEVKFISQESAIPNKDNEGKEGGDFMPVGGLSDVRKKYLEPYIQQYFENLKTQGIIPQSVQIPPLQYEKEDPVTPWVGTPFCPANSTIQQQRSTCVQKYREGVKANNSEVMSYKSKYDREQKTQIQITVRLAQGTTDGGGGGGTTSGCVTGLKIRIYVPSHKCQNAEFFVFANKTLLYNVAGGMTANLNNNLTDRGIPELESEPIFPPEMLNPGYGYLKNGDGTYPNYAYGKKLESGNVGGGRSDTFIITQEQSAQIVKDGNGYINIWMVGTTSTVHVDIPVVTITKQGVEQPIYNSKPKVKQGLLLTLDACGNKVVNSEGVEKVPDVSGYIQALKDERFPYILKIEKDRIKGEYSTLSNRGKRKVNLDEKAKLLERAEGLLQQMLDFTKQLKSLKPEEWTDGTAQNLITTNYGKFYAELTKEPAFTKNENGYTNSTVNGDLFGDIRMIMDRFYQGFDGIYGQPGDVSISGLTKKGKLDSAGILKNIRQI
jgi:hypothetical protein